MRGLRRAWRDAREDHVTLVVATGIVGLVALIGWLASNRVGAGGVLPDPRQAVCRLADIDLVVYDDGTASPGDPSGLPVCPEVLDNQPGAGR